MNFDKEAQHKRMLETPMPRLIVSLAIPTTASQLVTTIYNTADTYFVAQIGTSATAAVGVVFSLMSIIQAVGFGIGMGAGSLVSRRLGAEQEEEAHKYASSAFAAAIVFGLCLMILGEFGLNSLMRLLGSTDTILPYARSYAHYILAGAPIMCAAFVLNNVLRYEGEASMAMIGLCTGGILNMFLDPLFIFVFDMGIAGAALATVLSQCVSFLLLLSVFLRGRSIVKLHPRYVSLHPQDYLLIVRTGFPTICRQGLASLASALLNRQASLYGDAAVAAVTISNKIYLLVRNIVLGIGQGFQPVAGYNYGAKNHARVREAFVFSTKLGTVIATAAAVILALHAGTVISWFRADDPEVIRIGTTALYYACAVMPFMAYSTYVNQIHQSLGFSTRATFLACCRQGLCFIPLIYLLPAVLGLTGVQMAQPAADFFSFIIAVPFQVVFFRKELSGNA
ncbi:MAG: MATE family efflux transporter [Lachnospiraceae bacterium]|nr:MATE family efflux transporter [Lachnospiraceae bacterium]